MIRDALDRKLLFFPYATDSISSYLIKHFYLSVSKTAISRPRKLNGHLAQSQNNILIVIIVQYSQKSMMTLDSV